MRLLPSSLLASAAFLIALPALAQQGAPPPDAPPPPFERLDANRDGVITTEEARAARATLFDQIDANRDGFITREELRAHGEAMRAQRPDRRPDEKGERRMSERRPPVPGPDQMGRVDSNSDGTITRAEWDAAGAARAGQSAERRARVFAAIDTNNDGQLSREELEAFRAANPRAGERRGSGGPDRGDRREARDREAMRPDTDNDGRISRAEWMAAPDRMFERADTNRDGRVTREEAAAARPRGR